MTPAQTVDLHAIGQQAAELVEIAGMGSLQALEINKLKFDQEYQRDLNADFVQSLADRWNPKVAGAIVVNKRPSGGLWVIDGQHRTGAAKSAGETHILALVFENLTRAQEAQMRLDGNVRQPETQGQRFRAKLAAGDPESKAIAELCDAFGTRINFTPRTDKGINAVAAVEKLWRRDEGQVLAETFDVITRAWGNVSQEHARRDVLASIAHLLEQNRDEIDLARLVDRLQQEGTTGLRMKTNALQATWGGESSANWYRALVEVYNTGLPQRQRLHARIRGRS